MRRHIEEVCKDERFEQHRYNILDFSDATDFSPTERDLLINSGVLIAAAFTNHQVLMDSGVRVHGGAPQCRLIVQVQLRNPLI